MIHSHLVFKPLIPYLTEAEIDGYDQKNPWPLYNIAYLRKMRDGVDKGEPLSGQHDNHQRGTNHHAAKITPDIVRLIRARHYKTDVQAATILGLHPQTVRRIRRRELWAHIQ